MPHSIIIPAVVYKHGDVRDAIFSQRLSLSAGTLKIFIVMSVFLHSLPRWGGLKSGQR